MASSLIIGDLKNILKPQARVALSDKDTLPVDDRDRQAVEDRLIGNRQRDQKIVAIMGSMGSAFAQRKVLQEKRG